MPRKKKNHIETYEEIESRGSRLEALIKLSKDMLDKERRMPIPFNDFLYLASCSPEIVFRDIFQLFYDMVHYYIPEGIEEYPELPDSVGFLGYDCTNLFVRDCDNPFFADRLFAYRLMNLIESFREGTLQNHIFLFEGPAGSGKSTFLNNILFKLEEYTRTQQGTIYKTYWRLDIEKLGGIRHLQDTFSEHVNGDDSEEFMQMLNIPQASLIEYPRKYLQFSCPKHDHPILQIPKSYRKKFLDELIPDDDFKDVLFNKKEYEWVLKEIPCNICKSIFSTLLDELGDPLEVFGMINARKSQFNRQFGEGISVFNPGDQLYRRPIVNPILQSMINGLLKTDSVSFIFSDLAKTNNGVLALMDIKENNVERLMNLHGIISDGIHKVDLYEERIRTLFFGLVNPEDKVHYEKIKSFQDRIITVNIPYVLDYNTEVSIYKNKFGKDIEKNFLPQILENFAKIIISTRLNTDSPLLRKWILDPGRYSKYLDKNMLLLKMDIYTGRIPSWLSEEDLKRFDRQIRKDILAASENEGLKGISGRMSINVFNSFFSKYSKLEKLISMDNLVEFFTQDNAHINREIPEGFVDSLADMYDYEVLQQVKEALYFYNEKQITQDILNYLFAINFDAGTTEINPETGDKIIISEDYFKNFEALLLGTTSTPEQRKTFRYDNQNDYITKTLAQEMKIRSRKLTETEQFRTLFDKYTRSLKENALATYVDNDNFRRAILAYNTPGFNAYDERIKKDVTLLITNLKRKFKYRTEGARQISVYVLDRKLAKIY